MHQLRKVFCLNDTDETTFLGSMLPATGGRKSAATQLQQAMEKHWEKTVRATR